MAAVLEKKVDTQFGARVDEQIAEATSRIRVHDLAFGGLVLAAMLLAYATGMILLDKYVVLPELARQVALFGFLAALTATGYHTIVRPLRRQVNPLYAAVQVEKTIEDAKNSVIGYVDAKARADVPAAVRAAMSARAASSVEKADVNRAIDHRSLVYSGAVGIAFLLTLIVLFFVFRPTQFGSLVGRAFAPFTADAIATRTQINVVEPESGDTTLSAGQSITIKVRVSGRVPSPDKPDRVRVLLRHNPAAAEFEEVPMEKGETSRDWQVRIPEYLVRTGFWYKVAGGDYETPEYKVSVRTLPLVTNFEVSYTYPAYVRRAPETSHDPHLLGYAGTRVTVVGKTNRLVKDGRLTFEPAGRDPVGGKPVPERPDCVQFTFTLTEAGSYRITFTSTEGERAVDTAPFIIKIIDDAPPQIEVLKPEEDETRLPANGQLAVDARVGDDLGIDKVTLRMKIVEPVERPLADKPYQAGKSFRRESDDTWPRSLVYLDSVDFTKLTDATGQKVELKEGMVIAYWLEATDNRTKPGPNGPEPNPNLGKSKVKRVLVTPPQVAEEKAKLEEQKQQRKGDEAKHNEAQQQKFQNEKRELQKPPANAGENPPPNPAEQGEPGMNPENGMGENSQPMPGEKGATTPDPKAPMGPPKGPDGMPMPPGNGGDQPPPKGPDGMPMPGMGPDTGMPMPGNGADNGMNKPETAPPPRDDTDRTAKRVQDALNEQKNNGGSAKGNNAPSPEEQTPPAAPKMPPMSGAEPQSEPKPQPDAGMNGGAGAPGEPKSSPPAPKSNGTSEPKPQPNPKGGDTPPSSEKTEPKGPQEGASPAADKPSPANSQPMPPGDNGPKPKPDPTQPPPKGPSDAGVGKPDTQQPPQPPQGGDQNPKKGPDGAPMPSGPMSEQPQPKPGEAAGRPKPMPNGDPGMDKGPTPPESQNLTPDGQKPNNAGAGKPQKAPQPGATKPGPQDQGPMDKTEGANEPKAGPQPPPGGPSAPQPKGAAEDKPDQSNPANGAAGDPKSGEKAQDKPAPGQNPTGSQRADTSPKGDPGKSGTGEPKKLDPKTQKELENLAKDLTSDDPNRKKAAQDKLDKMIGKENRKTAEDIANGLKSDKPEERKAAQDKLKELAEKAQNAGQGEKKDEGSAQNPKKGPGDSGQEPKTGQGGTAQGPKKEEGSALEPKKGQGGSGQGPKKEEGSAQEPKTGQGGTGQEPKKEEGFAQNPKKGQGSAGQDAKADPKAVEQAMKDLNSADPKKRQEAKEKLDQMLGKGAGDKAEELNQKAQSPDPKQRDAGEKGLENLKQQATGGKEPDKKGPDQGPGSGGQKVDTKELAEAAKGLASSDPEKQKAARDKLDKMIGQENRKEAERQAKELTDDLKSGDKERQARAQKKLDEMKKQAEQFAKDNPPKKGPGEKADGGQKADPQAAENAIDDLNSTDPKRQQQAAETLDKMLGKGAADQAKEANRKISSGKEEEQKKGLKERDELIKKAEQMAKNPPKGPGGPGPKEPKGKELTQAEKEDLVKKLPDLNSPDEAKRQAAEKAFDDKIGEQKRKELQEAMKRKPGDDQQKAAEDAKRKLDEMQRGSTGGAADPTGNDTQPNVPRMSDPKLNPPMAEDLRNRAKSHELQLIPFEKNRYNKELHDQLGMTQAQYDEFLKKFQEETAKLKRDAAEAEKAEAAKPPSQPGANISQGSKVTPNPNATSGPGGVGSSGSAPPGFSDAMRKLQQGASTMQKK